MGRNGDPGTRQIGCETKRSGGFGEEVPEAAGDLGWRHGRTAQFLETAGPDPEMDHMQPAGHQSRRPCLGETVEVVRRDAVRSDERRVGKECVSKCKTRGWRS